MLNIYKRKQFYINYAIIKLKHSQYVYKKKFHLEINIFLNRNISTKHNYFSTLLANHYFKYFKNHHQIIHIEMYFKHFFVIILINHLLMKLFFHSNMYRKKCNNKIMNKIEVSDYTLYITNKGNPNTIYRCKIVYEFKSIQTHYSKPLLNNLFQDL